jgi:hypothetical protein
MVRNNFSKLMKEVRQLSRKVDEKTTIENVEGVSSLSLSSSSSASSSTMTVQERMMAKIQEAALQRANEPTSAIVAPPPLPQIRKPEV